MGLDVVHNKLHIITYPRSHMLVFDLARREITDLGRISCHNPLDIFYDKHGNAYTSTDDGRVLKVESERDALVEFSVKFPHLSCGRGRLNLLYDTVESPFDGLIYGATSHKDSRLFCYDPYTGAEGAMRDLGRGYKSDAELGPPWFH